MFYLKVPFLACFMGQKRKKETDRQTEIQKTNDKVMNCVPQETN